MKEKTKAQGRAYCQECQTRRVKRQNQRKYLELSKAVSGVYQEQTLCCQHLNSEGSEILEAVSREKG